MITEGAITLDFDMPKKVSKKLPVFYNPVMKLNRDISLEILKIIGKDRPLRIALPLAGSGIRGLRFLKETPDCVKEITFNDMMPGYETKLKKLLKLNKIPEDNVIIKNQDANMFLLESQGYDYIDIDPFGTPNPFLDAAVQRLARNGILAVTATDTSALAGTYRNVCIRNYDAWPLRNSLMHYVGVRIIARKVQLIGAQYEKALIPIFSYSKDHYYRIFFRCVKSKTACDVIMKQHQYLLYNRETLEYEFLPLAKKGDKHLVAGKLFIGDLWEQPFSDIDLISFISEEAKADGHLVDIHAFCEQHKLQIPNVQALQTALTKKKYTFARTHFNLHAIITNADYVVLKKTILALQH